MSERDDKDQLWSEATLWFARMRSPDAGEFRPQFEEWLSRGALHRRYYNRASEHWLHGTAAFAEERARIHGGENRGPERPRDNRNKRGVTAAVVAASVLVAVSTVLVVTRTGDGNREPQIAATQLPTRPAQLATTKGERRAVRLGDGSMVTLGESTLLQVHFANDIRRLQLDRGNARFDVAHEVRPFVVFAGGGWVTAHGTIFDVGLSPSHQVSVRLIRGSVEVSFPLRGATTARALHRTLHPGETVSFEAPVAAELPPDIARDYRDARLADIVGEANRGAAVQIRVASPAIGARLVSGRFRTDDTALLAQRLGALFDLDVDRSSKTEIVLRSR